jgi:hypothetical protein
VVHVLLWSADWTGEKTGLIMRVAVGHVLS